jgi:hypothetical protein
VSGSAAYDMLTQGFMSRANFKVCPMIRAAWSCATDATASFTIE